MAGSGNRGRHASLKVAAVESLTIRDVPFVHNVSVLCPSQLQRSLSVSNPCALLVLKNFENNIPDERPSLTLLLATADMIGWLGRDTLAAFSQSAQGKSKAKAPTPEHELAQKESEYNKSLREREAP